MTEVHPATEHVHALLSRRGHLPPDLAEISKRFGDLGDWIKDNIHGPEVTVALRHLFDAKNGVIGQHCMNKDAEAAATGEPQDRV